MKSKERPPLPHPLLAGMRRGWNAVEQRVRAVVPADARGTWPGACEVPGRGSRAVHAIRPAARARRTHAPPRHSTPRPLAPRRSRAMHPQRDAAARKRDSLRANWRGGSPPGSRPASGRRRRGGAGRCAGSAVRRDAARCGRGPQTSWDGKAGAASEGVARRGGVCARRRREGILMRAFACGGSAVRRCGEGPPPVAPVQVRPADLVAAGCGAGVLGARADSPAPPACSSASGLATLTAAS